MVKFTIHQRLPSLNEYVRACRGNKYAANKSKQDIEDMIIWTLRSIQVRIDKPIHIEFIWHEPNQKRDKDNVCFAKKFILDAMQKSGALPNDNNNCILGFTDVFVYDKQQKVDVTIWEENEHVKRKIL